jgi:hypothetical protein
MRQKRLGANGVAIAPDISHGDLGASPRPPDAQSVAPTVTLHPFVVKSAKKSRKELMKFSAPNRPHGPVVTARIIELR